MVKMKTVITLSFIAPFEKCKKKTKKLFILSHLLKDVCASCFNQAITDVEKTEPRGTEE